MKSSKKLFCNASSQQYKSMRWSLLVFLCLIATGCSAGNGTSVSGTITQDSQPLDAGRIQFRRSKGDGPVVEKSINQGTYNVDPSDGLRPGAYNVTVIVSSLPDREVMMKSRKRTSSQTRFEFRCELGENRTAVVDFAIDTDTPTVKQ